MPFLTPPPSGFRVGALLTGGMSSLHSAVHHFDAEFRRWPFAH